MILQKLVILTILLIQTHANQLNIGALFDGDDEINQKFFLKAIADFNSQLETNEFSLNGVSAKLTDGNLYKTSKKICKILRTGLIAIFGPTSDSASIHAAAICDTKEIPFIDQRYDTNVKTSTINLHPNPSNFILVLRDLVVAYEWKGFTILYESGPFLSYVKDLLELYGPKGYTVVVRKYNLDLNGNYRSVLRRIKHSGDKKIVIVGSIYTLPDLIQQLQQIGLMTDQYQYIIGNLDFHTLDLSPYQYSEANITSIRLIDEKYKQLMTDGLQTIGEEENAKSKEISTENTEENIFDNIRLSSALIYDGVMLLGETLRNMENLDMLKPVSLNCNDTNTWSSGFSLLNFLKTTTVSGLTGEIQFDHRGLRSQFKLDIIELVTSGIIKVGTWTPSNRLEFARTPHITTNSEDDRSLRNRTFLVLTALTPPYGMLKNSSSQLTGNERFEGYSIDLIHELSLMLGFSYIFKIQEDSVYGSYNSDTKSWNGMIREIMEKRADLAITDFTITAERESAVDFTMPFMNLGISILYRKPKKEPPKLFSFMSPFSNEVWLYLGASYIGVSLSFFILGRLSPVEWDNPYPCIEEPTVLENQFTLRNSFWFTIGALLQQGSEIAPKAPSTRAVASMWWFFTLIMVSSYTANLAAFLTVESLYSPISSAEDLANGNAGVKYGAKFQGATYNFFKDSTYPPYQRMYDYMKNHPELQPGSNGDGLMWTKTDNYAFLMESTSIEYIIERNCELTQVGQNLDEKGYGIAMIKNSPYRDALSQAVLKLQEGGILSTLKIKWWKEKGGGGACADTGDDGGALALELANLGGVFVCLIIGSFAAVVINMIEALINIKSRSVENNVPFKEELIEEIKFVFSCTGNTKTVSRKKDSSLSSRHSSSTLHSAYEKDIFSKENTPDK